jgi:hypothetical protein
MNRTGTYKWDPETQEMVKISDVIPTLRIWDATVPSGGYWDTQMAGTPIFIDSRQQKRKLMKKYNVREKNDFIGGGKEV